MAFPPTLPPSSLHEASTLLEPPDVAAPLRVAPALDLCHLGLVLRALLGVLVVLMLGSALESRTAEHWVARFTDASVVAVPAVLSWIVLVCGLRPVLQRCRPLLQTSAVTILGAAMALLAWRTWAQWLTLEAPSPWSGGAVAIGGALGAAVLVQGARLRALAQGPVGMQARWLLALVLLQIVWGAFTAGLDAGRIYNTWPLMNGSLMPENVTAFGNWWFDLSH
ncbi:MAG: COX15/CtaA family protein, partial [Inhella sp.]